MTHQQAFSSRDNKTAPPTCTGELKHVRRQYSSDVFWEIYRCRQCGAYPIFTVEGRPHGWNHIGVARSSQTWVELVSHQMHQVALGVGVAFNVALGGLHAGVPGQLLHIADTPADFGHFPRRPGNKGASAGMRGTSCHPEDV